MAPLGLRWLRPRRRPAIVRWLGTEHAGRPPAAPYRKPHCGGTPRCTNQFARRRSLWSRSVRQAARLCDSVSPATSADIAVSKVPGRRTSRYHRRRHGSAGAIGFATRALPASDGGTAGAGTRRAGGAGNVAARSCAAPSGWPRRWAERRTKRRRRQERWRGGGALKPLGSRVGPAYLRRRPAACRLTAQPLSARSSRPRPLRSTSAGPAGRCPRCSRPASEGSSCPAAIPGAAPR